MLISKVYKWRKLIICVVIILGIAFYFLTNSGTGNNTDVVHTYSNLSYIKESKVIDKQMVIESLEKAAKLVTVEGHSVKKFIYTDSIFQEHNWIKDAFGQRSLEITAEVFFKTGINISDIINEDGIRVYGSTLHIKIPKEVLVSLEIPFDKLGFFEQNGLIRSSLSIEDKQMLYSEMKKIVEQEIMTNDSVKEQTYNNAKEIMVSLLEKIPNCNKIIFSPRMD